MSTDLLLQHLESIVRASEDDLHSDPTLGGRLRIATDQELTISYAPFEYIAAEAKLVIVGITPGAQQAANALVEARRQLLAGASADRAIKAAKMHASFSGPMRSNLVAMLDYIGLNRWANVDTTAALWAGSAELVHFTSALRYPVFVGGKNYSGTPSMKRTPILRHLITVYLAQEAAKLPDALWVPLGPKAEEGLSVIVDAGGLSKGHVLSGLPHPSGANAERIAYFLGWKERTKLSSKTSADAIDRARDGLLKQMADLM